jgi:putative membrane protein
MTISQLPTLNAILNSTSAVFLIIGFLLIRQKNVAAHRICMGIAFTTSVLFLISYLIYHATAGAVHYQGTGWIRAVYFAILITHTILAATVPVLATITLVRALQARYDKHRKIARWTLPIWLYVSVTGVIIYLMLY